MKRLRGHRRSHGGPGTPHANGTSDSRRVASPWLMIVANSPNGAAYVIEGDTHLAAYVVIFSWVVSTSYSRCVVTLLHGDGDEAPRWPQQDATGIGKCMPMTPLIS